MMLLGFQDEKINPKDHVDWSVNKIGGAMFCAKVPLIPLQLPANSAEDWKALILKDVMLPLVVVQPLFCKLCASALLHLVQIYCPLSNSQYHRTLNIFGCVSPGCCSKPESLVVLRSQMLEEKRCTRETDTKEVSSDCWDDWGMFDDWDTNSDDLDNILKLDGTSNLNGFVQCEHIDEQMTEASDICKINESSQICPSGESGKIMEKIGEEKQIADVSIQFNDTLSLTVIRQFSSFYIYAFSEEETKKNDLNGDTYAQKVYDDYLTREGVRSRDLEASRGDGSELYEKVDVKHGDRSFHKFKKVLSRAPKQILRYQWRGQPLRYTDKSELSTSFETIPKCQYCCSKRTYELQLMPHLMYCLQNDEIDGTPFEFGSIYIFSCESSCWESSETTPREEFIVIQEDPDQNLLTRETEKS